MDIFGNKARQRLVEEREQERILENERRKVRQEELSKIQAHNKQWREQLSPDASRAWRVVEQSVAAQMYRGGSFTSYSYTDNIIQALLDSGFLWPNDPTHE